MASAISSNKPDVSYQSPGVRIKLLPDGWWWMIPVLLIAGYWTFSSGINGVFLYDDIKEIGDNPNITRIWPVTTPLFSANKLPVRPIPYLSFALNYAVHGHSVEGYHYTNIIIHILTGILLCWALWQTFSMPGVIGYIKNPEILSFCCILLWLVHPLQTQAVTYIYQRMEQLMSLFFACTWVTFILAVSTKSGMIRLTFYFLSIFSCLLGTLSKEVMVVVPVFILWYDRVFILNSWQEIVKQRWWYYVAIFSCWIVLGLLIKSQVELYPEYQRVMPGRFEYLMTQSEVITHYLKLVFYPRRLCFEYGWPVVRNFSEIWLPFCFICGLFSGTIYLIIRHPTWGFLAGSFFLFLGPTSSINPVLAPAFEHRMYLSLLAICVLGILIINFVLERIFKPKSDQTMNSMLLIFISFLIACPLSNLSHARCRLYASFETIWLDTLQKAPHNYLPYYMLGHYYDVRGDPQQAIAYCQKAVELGPLDPDSHNNLGLCLIELNRIPEAEIVLRNNQINHPQHLDTLNNLGTLFGIKNDLKSAENCFSQIIKLRPDHMGAKCNLARVFLMQGDCDSADSLLQDILRTEPANFPAAVLTAESFLLQNKYTEAKQIIDQLIQKYADHPEITRLRSQLAEQSHGNH